MAVACDVSLASGSAPWDSEGATLRRSRGSGLIILVRGFGLFRFLMLDDKDALGWWRSYLFGLSWFGRGVSEFEIGM